MNLASIKLKLYAFGGLLLTVLAFFVERMIDIVKVPPANYVERRWPGGWGVVGDDVVAGLYTCALLHLIIWYKPLAMWVGL